MKNERCVRNAMAIYATLDSRLRFRMLKFILEKKTGSSQGQNNIHKLYFPPQKQTKTL